MARSVLETAGRGLRSGSAMPGGRRRWLVLALVRLVVVAGLAIDSYVHFDLAGLYSEAGGVINEGVLFRAEAIVALAVAILVAVTGRRVSYAAAFIVAASALTVLLVARYADIGAIGPFPDMYDPVWFGEKALAAVGEAVAGLAALAGYALVRARRRTR